jgi:hypothetical protein
MRVRSCILCFDKEVRVYVCGLTSVKAKLILAI